MPSAPGDLPFLKKASAHLIDSAIRKFLAIAQFFLLNFVKKFTNRFPKFGEFSGPPVTTFGGCVYRTAAVIRIDNTLLCRRKTCSPSHESIPNFYLADPPYTYLEFNYP